MRDKQLIRILMLSFLLLSVLVLLVTNPLVSEAQSKSNVPKLEGTEWEFKVKQTAPGLLTFAFYEFGKGGVVELSIITMNAVGVPPRIQYNSQGIEGTEYERGRTEVVPGISSGAIFSTASLTGTYRQNDNSVLIEFSDHRVEATIIGNRMAGYFLTKNMQQKWEAWNTSGTIQSSNEGSASSSNRSSSLSVLQRLPKQLGQFKQKAIMFHHCSPDPAKPSDPLDLTGGIYEKDPLRDCAKGDIEVLAAFYGEGETVVSVEKHENSAKATERMMNENSSSEIVKREPVKNRAGQTVGELFMFQSAPSESIVFTFGRYYYRIISRRGDAQKVFKSLPLE